jgi:hypothetical protein
MLGALTHVVNVAFGDDAVGAACGLDQGGAGCVQGLPGAGDALSMSVVCWVSSSR